jgi:hypothetical protein
MMATEPPPPSGFSNFNQDFSSYSEQSLHSFHPDGNSLDNGEVSWGSGGNNAGYQNHNHGESSVEVPSAPNNWSQMPEKSIGFSNILSKLSAGTSTPPLAPKDPDTTTPSKFPTKKELIQKNPNLNPTAKIYAPSPPVSPPFESRHGNPNANPWSLDNGGNMHGKQQNNSPAPNSWGGNGGAWGQNSNRQFDRHRGVRGSRNDQPSASFVIRPAEPSQEDRYECTRLPSGIVVQTHSGQAVEFWERVHVPRSMFDISGLGPNS